MPSGLEGNPALPTPKQPSYYCFFALKPPPILATASSNCSGLTLPFSTVTVALPLSKNTFAFFTPLTLASADCTRGAQLTAQDIPSTLR